jgi:hypothetical protein
MMTAASPHTASEPLERSRILLINGAEHDDATTSMITFAADLLREDGVDIDVFVPASEQPAHIAEQWLAAHAVIVIAPAGSTALAARLGQAIDAIAASGASGQLAERAYGLVVHGDATAAQPTRHAIAAWLDGMNMVDADSFATLDRYLGYHDASQSDALKPGDDDHRAEVRNVAHAVTTAITELRAGRLSPPERRTVPDRRDTLTRLP